MPKVLCKICRKEFKAKPFSIKNGWGLFCSKKCQYQSFRNGEEMACSICGEKNYKNKSQIARSKSKKYFCSKSCQTKWRNSQYVGERHLGWKHGMRIYRNKLLKSKVLQICILCKEDDTRILAVHHVDENRSNNKLENLVWLCHNCHHLVHRDKQEKNKLLAYVRR